MQTRRDFMLMSWLMTLLAGAVAAVGIWLVAGQSEAAAFGFVIAAVARDLGSCQGCARRLLREPR